MSSVVDSQEAEKYLRIASISIALYDFLITLPAEWRFYRSQLSILNISLACVLFILIRYFSIVVMVVSNYGVFSTSFTKETCQHYYLIAPTFKVIQVMISQVIIGVRTFNIARRDRRVGIALVTLYIASISLEWFTNMFDRIPVTVGGNCTPGNSGKTLSAYLYYLAAMLYDLVMLTISTVYLLRYNPLSNRLGRLVRVLIYEGLGYFIVLTGANVFNLILYRVANVQNQAAGASLGYAVTWIMSQRILIHRREMSTPESRPLDNVVLARPVHSSRNMTSPLRSQFDSKGHMDVDMPTSPRNARNGDVELDIHVCVERSVVVDYMDESEHTSSCGKPTV